MHKAVFPIGLPTPRLMVHFSNLPPFSFTYNEKSSDKLLPRWSRLHETTRLDNVRVQHTYTYSDPETKLRVICRVIEYTNFPAIEWIIKFRNDGTAETPVIENIQALNTTFIPHTTSRRLRGVIMHRVLGSSAQRTDFAPVEEEIEGDTSIRLTPVGGRSSNTTSLPFFNIEFSGIGGVIVAIGWSGQWAALFSGNSGSRSVHVEAGMELTHLKLYPKEEIRTPRILLLFWRGEDYLIGQNMFRRFVVANLMPKVNGKPVELPFSAVGPPRYFDPSLTDIEFNDATEQNQIAFAKRYHELGLYVDYWWIDAGWFEGKWPNGVGNWFPRKDGFPNGLRPISETVKRLGMKGLVLWFEPERVHEGTWLDREHPEWILKLPGKSDGLLNLGNENARKWLTEYISKIIENEGVSVYRHDFNIDPLPFWRAADEPDRQGITEIRYIEGLYAYWDELLNRHPGLIIDNCASGGRRIDLETISRSVVLWRTDYQYFEPNGYQCHTYGINLFLPTTSTGCNSTDTYTFRSSMSNGMVISWNLYQPNFPVEQARHLINEFRRLRAFFLGDYYPLTPYNPGDDALMAYQFHRDDMHEGIVLVFRRHKCPISKVKLNLRALSPSAIYEVSFEDIGIKKTMTGKELLKGIEVEIKDAPGSLLITYREVQSADSA